VEMLDKIIAQAEEHLAELKKRRAAINESEAGL
jgi:hypothetical protein